MTPIVETETAWVAGVCNLGVAVHPSGSNGRLWLFLDIGRVVFRGPLAAPKQPQVS